MTIRISVLGARYVSVYSGQRVQEVVVWPCQSSLRRFGIVLRISGEGCDLRGSG
jgi:hypothetical protein